VSNRTRTLGLVIIGALLMISIMLWLPNEGSPSAAVPLARHDPGPEAVEQLADVVSDQVRTEIEPVREAESIDAAPSPSPAIVAATPAPEIAVPYASGPLPPLETLSLDELEAALRERTTPLYQARFASGLYEVLQQPLRGEDFPEGKLIADRFELDGITVHRAILPEADHPDEYALWREIRRRRDAIREADVARAREEAAQLGRDR